MDHEERKKYALQWVNRRRKEGGSRATSRLSRGFRSDTRLCPIAKSLEKVGVISADFSGDGVALWGYNCKGEECSRLWKDPDLAGFMEAFDHGEYPELEVPPTPIKINGKVVT